MRGIRFLTGKKADTLVEPRCVGVFGAETHVTEVLPGLLDQRGYQSSSEAPVSPCRPDVDASDSNYIRSGREWIAIETSHRDQQSLIRAPTENFAWCIETILSA